MTPEQTFGQLLGLGKSWRVVECIRAVNPMVFTPV
jgi:hypothetical protein